MKARGIVEQYDPDALYHGTHYRSAIAGYYMSPASKQLVLDLPVGGSCVADFPLSINGPTFLVKRVDEETYYVYDLAIVPRSWLPDAAKNTLRKR